MARPEVAQTVWHSLELLVVGPAVERLVERFVVTEPLAVVMDGKRGELWCQQQRVTFKADSLSIRRLLYGIRGLQCGSTGRCGVLVSN